MSEDRIRTWLYAVFLLAALAVLWWICSRWLEMVGSGGGGFGLPRPRERVVLVPVVPDEPPVEQPPIKEQLPS